MDEDEGDFAGLVRFEKLQFCWGRSRGLIVRVGRQGVVGRYADNRRGRVERRRESGLRISSEGSAADETADHGDEGQKLTALGRGPHGRLSRGAENTCAPSRQECRTIRWSA